MTEELISARRVKIAVPRRVPTPASDPYQRSGFVITRRSGRPLLIIPASFFINLKRLLCQQLGTFSTEGGQARLWFYLPVFAVGATSDEGAAARLVMELQFVVPVRN